MMSLPSKIKENLTSLIVIILLIIILLQRCGSGGNTPEAPKIVRDTVWIHKDSVILSRPQVVKTIPVNIYHDTIINHYIPDTNYAKLVVQYQDVVNQLLAKNIMQDSIRIDSNGYVKITDTVQRNMVVGRSSEVSIKYPIIKETITLPAPKVTQLYVGGQLSGNSGQLINGINGGLLLKNKRDQIYGANIGLNTQGQVSYGVQSYWKLKLK